MVNGANENVDTAPANVQTYRFDEAYNMDTDTKRVRLMAVCGDGSRYVATASWHKCEEGKQSPFFLELPYYADISYPRDERLSFLAKEVEILEKRLKQAESLLEKAVAMSTTGRK